MAPPFEPIRKRDYVLADFRRGAEYLLSTTRHRPKIAVILGSGLSELVRSLEDADSISYEKVHEALPYFPTCSVPGHKGNFVFGSLDGVSIMVMQGRFHLYEGHSPQAVTYPIRMMKEMGIETLIITNAAGGLSPTLRAGDVMLITDHFNTAWGENHPLIGPNIDAQGPRFIACSNLYDRDLRAMALRVARDKVVDLKQGYYIYTSGPSFETPMEVRLFRFMSEKHPHLGPVLKTLRLFAGLGYVGYGLEKLMRWLEIGESVVGMSTVPEVLVANHAGIKVLAVSGISNLCVDDIREATGHGRRRRRAESNPDEASHEEVQAVMDSVVCGKLLALVRGVVAAQDDGSDIEIGLDEEEIARWKVPTQLCVPWNTFFFGLSLSVLVVVGAVSPSLVRAAYRSVALTLGFRRMKG